MILSLFQIADNLSSGLKFSENVDFDFHSRNKYMSFKEDIWTSWGHFCWPSSRKMNLILHVKKTYWSRGDVLSAQAYEIFVELLRNCNVIMQFVVQACLSKSSSEKWQ